VGATLTTTGSSVPTDGTVTVNWYSGCTNSEITLTKTSASAWTNIGTNPLFENNLTSSSTSYTTASSPAIVYYTAGTTGDENISLGSTTLANYIQLTGDRLVAPVITLISNIANPCPTASINLSNTLTSGQTSDIIAYKWEVTDVASPTVNVYTSTSANPGTVNPPSGGWVLSHTYQVRFQLQENCCGWSIPMYQTFTIPSQLVQVSTITQSPSGTACAYQTGVTYTASTVSGATSYVWTVTGGGTITSGQNTSTVTVNWGPSFTGATVSVIPENSCAPSTNGPSQTKTLNINGLPNVSITPGSATTFCNGGNVVLTAGASSGGGTGTGAFTYAWSPSTGLSANTGTPVTSTPPSGGTYVYTVVATESGSGCSASVSQTVIDVANPSGGSISSTSFCSGNSTTVTVTGESNATTYSWSLPGGLTGSSTTSSITVSSSSANTYIITVTPQDVASGITCTGSQVTGTVTVNPTPALTSSTSPPAICSGTIFSYIPTSVTGSVTFSWTRALVTGISNSAGSGTGNPNEMLTNTTASAVAVTYVYTLSTSSCTNPTTYNVVVMVNPEPTLTSTLSPGAVCSGNIFSYTPTSGIGSVTFSWTRAVVTGISNSAGSGTDNPSEALTNTTTSAVNVTYVYTLSTSSCTNSTTYNVVVEVEPPVSSYGTLSASGGLTQTVCDNVPPNSGNPVTVTGAAGSSGSFTYQWYYQAGLIAAPGGSSTTGWTACTPTQGTGYNTASFTIAGPSANITYACFVTTASPACGTGQWATNDLQVTVLTTGPTESASGGASACIGGSVTLTSSLSVGIPATYQWYSSTSIGMSSPTAISGATTTTYSPSTATAGTLYYEIIATFSGSGCSPATSNVQTVLHLSVMVLRRVFLLPPQVAARVHILICGIKTGPQRVLQLPPTMHQT
jgi:hypothetical protein